MSTPFDVDGIHLSEDVRADLASLPALGDRAEVPAPHGQHTAGDTTVIIGHGGMLDLMEGLTSLVSAATGMSRRFQMIAEGESTAMPALLMGATLLAPLPRRPWPQELAAYRAVHGEDPVLVQIGHAGHGPRRTGPTPPAVYVHSSNPVRAITLEQLRLAAARGQEGGSIRRWSQLGAQSWPFASRRIHLYGLPTAGGTAADLAETVLGGARWAEHYEEVADARELAHAIAADRYGLGIAGPSAAWRHSAAIRPLAVAPVQPTEEDEPPATPGHRDIYEGRYPLAQPLLLGLSRDRTGRIEPLALEMCRAALSREGQELVAQLGAAEQGYVPLRPALREQQLAALDYLS